MAQVELHPSIALVLARNLVALREKGEWSQRALASQAHVSDRMLLHIEKGETNPSLSTVDKLAQALDVNTTSLFGKHPVARRKLATRIEAIVAQNLVAARRRQALTQEGLSKLSGVSMYVIAHVERQARNPSLNTLAKLAEALGVTLEELLADEGASKQAIRS